MPVIQEFQISITPLRGSVNQDSYLLRTETVAKGVPLAETQVVWPVERWLMETTQLAQDPLQRLLAASASEVGETTGQARPGAALKLGQDLYQHLFQEQLRDSWLAAQGVAQNRQQPLRLRLGFKDSRLQRLPWELLYGDDRPLATGMDVTLCRCVYTQNATSLAVFPPLAEATTPLNVLVVVSAPEDQERLALSREITYLQTELRSPNLATPIQSPPRFTGLSLGQPLTIHLTLLQQPGRSELVQALEQGHFQMLHYAGHSDVSETGGDLFLVNPQTGLTEILSGEDLAGLLVNNGIWLAVFNSCRGAYTPDQGGWREQNLVQALANRGVPAVIAMAERIPDDVAIAFTQLLYRNLRQGYPIDLCLSRVRQGLAATDRMLPLLYLRPEFDGYLYLRHGQSTDSFDDLPLLLPDYANDPEIGDLAQDLFTPAEAIAGSPPPAAPEESPDWLTDLEPLVGSGPTVSDVIDHLTTSEDGQVQSTLAPPSDSSPRAYPGAPPDRPLVVPSSDTQSSPASPLKPKRPLSLPRALIVGLVGLGTLAGIGLALVGRPPFPIATTNGSAQNRPAVPSPSGVDQGETITRVRQALSRQDMGQVRQLIEQLLDQGDFSAAQAAIATVPSEQLDHPDIAFVRGRLAWQQSGRRDTEVSPNDALRAWSQATQSRPDFLEAWVAQGFASYLLGDDDQAIAAWSRAVELDQAQLRILDPDGQRQVASAYTGNAIAGLAMARQRQSQQAIDAEQGKLQQEARSYFLRTTSIDPSFLDVSTLNQRWLWTPTLIENWRTSLTRFNHDAHSSVSPDS